MPSPETTLVSRPYLLAVLAADDRDRACSIEMFEHMRSYEARVSKIAGLLKPNGKVFVHVFTHRVYAYPYEDTWMARKFFTGGTMPSDELLPRLSEVGLAGRVRRIRSNFIHGIKEMPTRVMLAG